MLLQGKSTVI